MQLEHSFTVPVPIAQAWKVLLDIEQIAPCMPGAVLDSVDGDDFTGRVKVKLGPISLTYKGKASFVKKDEATHTAVIDAAGKDQRGNGTAAATVTATLKDEGASTRVDVLTDLNITGKPAQFGRGVMVDVGNKLIGQFAACVEGKLGATDEPADGAAAESSASNGAGSDSAGDPGGRHAAEVAAGQSAGARDGSTDASGGDSAGQTAAGGTSADAGSDAAAAGPDATGAAAAKAAPGASATKPSSGADPGETSASGPRAVPAREPEPIDLLEVAGGSVLTRIGIPAAGLAAAVAVLIYIIRKIRD